VIRTSSNEGHTRRKFKEEIMPFNPSKKEQTYLTGMRTRDTDLQAMAKLKPVFKEGGRHAGNSSRSAMARVLWY